MTRLLSVVHVATSDEEKCMTVEFGERKVDVQLRVLEPMRALGKWFASTDLRQLFGDELLPYHASLMGALASQFSVDKGPPLPLTVDMERLEAAVVGGSSVHDALVEQSGEAAPRTAS